MAPSRTGFLNSLSYQDDVHRVVRDNKASRGNAEERRGVPASRRRSLRSSASLRETAVAVAVTSDADAHPELGLHVARRAVVDLVAQVGHARGDGDGPEA